MPEPAPEFPACTRYHSDPGQQAQDPPSRGALQPSHLLTVEPSGVHQRSTATLWPSPCGVAKFNKISLSIIILAR